MADAYLRMNYVLEVSDKDMRLICLALAGKLKGHDDQKAAKELNLKLLKAQQIRVQEQQVKLEGALRRANEQSEDTHEVQTP